MITWLNGTADRFSAYIGVYSYRESDGSVRVAVEFRKDAAAELGLQRGERLLFGVDAEEQTMLFKPTLFGGHQLVARPDRSRLRVMFTSPFRALPRLQHIEANQLRRCGDHAAFPYQFDMASAHDVQRLRTAA